MAVSSDPDLLEVRNEMNMSGASLRELLNAAFGSPVGDLRDFAGYTYDTTAPTAPSNLSGSGDVSGGTGDYSLDWDASSDSGSGVWRYRIYRNGSQIATVTHPTTSYSGTQGAQDSNQYYVKAEDYANNISSASNTVTVVTDEIGACLIEGTPIMLSDGSVVPIESLAKGDQLLGADIKGFEDTNDVRKLYDWTGKQISKKDVPTKILSIEPKRVTSTVSINDGQLQASNPHSQLVKRDGQWKFVPLHEVQVGDLLYDKEGELIETETIETIVQEATVYKMTLSEPVHTFYANGILTHNVKF